MIWLLRFCGNRRVMALFDALLVYVGFGFSFSLLWALSKMPKDSAFAHWQYMLVISLAVPLTLNLMDAYRDWLHRPRTQVIYSVTVAITITLLIVTACTHWFHQVPFSGFFLILSAAIQTALIAGYRVLSRTVYRAWFGSQNTIVIGETERAAYELAETFATEHPGIYRIERCFGRKRLRAPYKELECASTVVVSGGIADKDELILHCLRHQKQLLVVPTISELSSFGAEPRVVKDLLVFGVHPHRIGPVEELAKRTCDVIGSAFLLALVSPLALALSIAIPLNSHGPILYRQERIGKGRRRFWILKFRTMVQDAERLSGPMLATARDSRITSLGHWLRSIRMDEIPQLWNVLRGEMSLVGPRPEREFFVEQFERELPAYEHRHWVRPGITGLAQVMGSYGSSARRKLDFDLYYIFNYSLLLDLKILLQTIVVVLRREQSSGLQAGSEHDVRAVAHGNIEGPTAVQQAADLELASKM